MDDWLKNGLPTFSGAKDKGVARRMVDALGGPNGFRTAQITNVDGSVTVVQLKGSMPPQITTMPAPAKPRVIGEYVEYDLNLRTYHEDHMNYHIDNDISKPLRPYVLKYIKTVVFGGVRMEFSVPSLPVAINRDYYSHDLIGPNNTMSGLFDMYYPRAIETTPETEAIKYGPNYFEGTTIYNNGVNRTFFPEGVFRSCDGAFFTKYKPIRTLTLGVGVTFYFLNPLDRGFRW